MSPVGD